MESKTYEKQQELSFSTRNMNHILRKCVLLNQTIFLKFKIYYYFRQGALSGGQLSFFFITNLAMALPRAC